MFNGRLTNIDCRSTNFNLHEREKKTQGPTTIQKSRRKMVLLFPVKHRVGHYHHHDVLQRTHDVNRWKMTKEKKTYWEKFSFSFVWQMSIGDLKIPIMVEEEVFDYKATLLSCQKKSPCFNDKQRANIRFVLSLLCILRETIWLVENSLDYPIRLKNEWHLYSLVQCLHWRSIYIENQRNFFKEWILMEKGIFFIQWRTSLSNERNSIRKNEPRIQADQFSMNSIGKRRLPHLENDRHLNFKVINRRKTTRRNFCLSRSFRMLKKIIELRK